MNTVYLISYAAGRGFDESVMPLIVTPYKRKAHTIKRQLEQWLVDGFATDPLIRDLVRRIAVADDKFRVIIEPVAYTK